MILANNGGFWPQGVMFILWNCAILVILYFGTQWLRIRIPHKLGKYGISVLRIGLFMVSLLLSIIVIGGTANPDDPNQEQRDRLQLNDD